VRPRFPRSGARRSFALCAWLFVAAPAWGATGYVFSTFHNDTPAGEQLSIYRSQDALNFTLVSDTGFAGPSGYLRDPSIMRYFDGQYYVAYTDPIGVGCCGKVDHFSIASSADLVHWSNLTTVPAGVPNVAHTWAPEWFVDGPTVYVIANIDTLNTDSDFKPYAFTAVDATLTRWSGPIPLGFGPNYIDTFVLKVRGVYHAFAKNETTRYLEHATAPSLTGPWTFVGTGNWSGFGTGMEGPCVVQLDDGTWRIFVDAQFRPITARFLTATSPDLNTWSAPIVLPGLGSLRHGTVIRDTPIPAVPPDAGTVDNGGSPGLEDAATAVADATAAGADGATAAPPQPHGATDAPATADAGDSPVSAGAGEPALEGGSPIASAGDAGASPSRSSHDKGGCSCDAAKEHGGAPASLAVWSILAFGLLRRGPRSSSVPSAHLGR
jgi:hypothetical protein